ncbi:hypothetical protein OAB00_00405 [Akkermansiaceae bacterium]|nr:hypothetical protein [Akkermansiaceae bacterium]
MNTFRDLAKKLKPRNPWFGATYEEAPVRAMRDASTLTGDAKLQWLEEMYFHVNPPAPPKAGSVPLPPICDSIKSSQILNTSEKIQ